MGDASHAFCDPDLAKHTRHRWVARHLRLVEPSAADVSPQQDERRCQARQGRQKSQFCRQATAHLEALGPRLHLHLGCKVHETPPLMALKSIS